MHITQTEYLKCMGGAKVADLYYEVQFKYSEILVILTGFEPGLRVEMEVIFVVSTVENV